MTALLAELAIGVVEEQSTLLILKDHMELVDDEVGSLALLGIGDDTVEHGIGDGEKSCGLQLTAKVVDVIADKAVAGVHIGLVGEYIQRAGGEQFQGKGQIPRLGLGLLLELLPESAERGDLAFLALLPVDGFHTTVDDGLLVSAHAGLVDLLDEGHDELALGSDGVLIAITVHHVHGVDAVGTVGGALDHGSLESPGQRGVLTLGVTDENIRVRGQDERHNEELGKEGLAGAGNAKENHGLVQEGLHVAEDHVLGNGVLAQIDAALLLDLLHLKRHEHRQRLGGEGAVSADLLLTDGKHGVETVHLLILQNSQLTHPLPGNGLQSFGVAVQLFLGVGSDDHSHEGKHHALVPGGEVIEKLLDLLALKFDIMGQLGGEVVIVVLTALPVGGVGLHAQEPLFHLSDGLIHGYGDDIDGEHHIPVEVGEFRDHVVLHIGGKLLHVKGAAVGFAHFEVVLVPFDAVRANIVPEVTAKAHTTLNVVMESSLIAGAVEVVEDAEPLFCMERNALGAESGEVCVEVGGDAVEISTSLLNVFLVDGNGDVLLLSNAADAVGLVQKHLVVFLAVLVQTIPAVGDKDGLLEVHLVETVVVDGDLYGGAAVQTVQKLRVGKEHPLLVLLGCYLVVNVGKAEGHIIAGAGLENAVCPDAFYRDKILHLTGDFVFLLIELLHGLYASCHGACTPPTIKLRFKARQPAVSFTISKPKLLEWESKWPDICHLGLTRP